MFPYRFGGRRRCRLLLTLIFLSGLIYLLILATREGGDSQPRWNEFRGKKRSLTTLPQDHELIIKFIIENQLLQPPSPASEPYDLQFPKIRDPSNGYAEYILKNILKDMRNGFFVEAGALDGETRSNTLFMERELGWTGLLVEADPLNYQTMIKLRRKAWTANACLATEPYPHTVTFEQNFNLGKIIGGSEDGHPVKLSPPSDQKNGTVTAVTVQCIPFYSLMAAMNVTVVDYFSLDVEGSELKVLKTIPFNKILIKVLSVEFIHTHEGKAALKAYMEGQGYVTAKNARYRADGVFDFFFIHKSLQLPNL